MREKTYDAIVVGSGHAGVESALALAKMGKKTMLLTLSLDSIAFLACNPSIGGTAKGQLAGEVTALGGAIGRVADKTALQMRLLNAGKGVAVQSLRAQVDKNRYHTEMKKLVENTENLYIRQAEVVDVLVENGKVIGVKTAMGQTYFAAAVVLACGVYLCSTITTGYCQTDCGPNGNLNAKHLSKSLEKIGHKITRFKTGTPARVHSRSINFDKMEMQDGEAGLSFSGVEIDRPVMPCYLTYTNETTHKIINDNMQFAPVYDGTILGVGPRYCPSIETKVTRFADKSRHQVFIEPEAFETSEVYIQGMSTSFGPDIQEKIYRSIKGLEQCEIVRYAYAIEYDCIDPLSLNNALGSKVVKGLYFAGQINGTSGYEEAAAQGIIAGINAGLYIDNEPAFVLGREEAYIGVLIDDLITMGVDEPYRMMTSRAEYRLLLRQDNCDMRLKKYAIKYNQITQQEYDDYLEKEAMYNAAIDMLEQMYKPSEVKSLFENAGEVLPQNSISLKGIIRRNKIDIYMAKKFLGVYEKLPKNIMEMVNTFVKYEGYIAMQSEQIEKTKKAAQKKLPADIDYLAIEGLRIEARQKLDLVRPENVGQASRISGVSPSDINVLLVVLASRKG